MFVHVETYISCTQHSCTVAAKLVSMILLMCPHPPYSPDLILPNFDYFLWMKGQFKTAVGIK
jgi:hypothetical protein